MIDSQFPHDFYASDVVHIKRYAALKCVFVVFSSFFVFVFVFAELLMDALTTLC